MSDIRPHNGSVYATWLAHNKDIVFEFVVRAKRRETPMEEEEEKQQHGIATQPKGS